MEDLFSDRCLMRLMKRSRAMHDTIIRLLQDAEPAISPDDNVVHGICIVAIEQAGAVRYLLSAGLTTSAATLLNAQFETLIRAVWMERASEWDAPRVTPAGDAHPGARLSPAISEMLSQICASADTTGGLDIQPALCRAHAMSERIMDDYVRRGIHHLLLYDDPRSRALPFELVKISNQLLLTTACALAGMLKDNLLQLRLASVPDRYTDCLPPANAPIRH